MILPVLQTHKRLYIAFYYLIYDQFGGICGAKRFDKGHNVQNKLETSPTNRTTRSSPLSYSWVKVNKSRRFRDIIGHSG